jgi:hypothetical protein
VRDASKVPFFPDKRLPGLLSLGDNVAQVVGMDANVIRQRIDGKNLNRSSWMGDYVGHRTLEQTGDLKSLLIA